MNAAHLLLLSKQSLGHGWLAAPCERKPAHNARLEEACLAELEKLQNLRKIYAKSLTRAHLGDTAA